MLATRPDAGAVVRSGGGLRKIRWALPGSGKSGGVRVINYYATARDQILMLALYAKSEQANLSDAQVKILRGYHRGGVSMNDEHFAELVGSVREGGAILRGESAPSRSNEVAPPDVKGIREGYGLSQGEFAALLGVSVTTLRGWEQGRRAPAGVARLLLQIAVRHPRAVREVLRPVSRGRRAVV